jgi:hypothetical protein
MVYSTCVASPADPDMLDTFTQRRYTAMLFDLRAEHRDLDLAIAQLISTRPEDELSIKRLKKRKLKIKDQIEILENLLIPDLNA